MKKLDVRQYQDQNKLSMEEAARHLRYLFFEETARQNNFNRIALAHHMEDNAETVLMALFRGSGPLGLSGIPPTREDKYIRPLIRTSRSELLEFLRANAIPYHLDASNKDPVRTRNRIRQHLIPHIQQHYNPRIVQTLNRLAEVMRSEDHWAHETVAPLFENALIQARKTSISLSVPKLLNVHGAAARRMIRMALIKIKGDLKRITYQHVDMIIEFITRGPDRGSIDLPARIRAHKNDDILYLSREKTPLRGGRPKLKAGLNDSGPGFFEYQISDMGMLWIKEAGVHLKLSRTGLKGLPDFSRAGGRVAFLDMDRLHLPLTVRNVRPGDRFTPLGMTGTQKVKNYFIDHKVSRAQRSKCPILLSQGKIVWIAGHRIDDAVKVGPHTGNILTAELLLA